MIVVVALLVAAGPVRDIEDLSLRELLNADTTVASSKATPLRETPGVVTVVSRDEIQASGARDLIDVLLLVPGFTFGVDVAGVVSVAFRGNWGHEGKVLLLYDGQEMNETLYLTLQFGNHYPVDNIERVEIIRGPGSALYGGYAELAVVNIVTRKGGDIEGVGAWGEYGQEARDYGRRDVGAFYGQKYTGALDGLSVSVDGVVGQGNRSDGVYTDLAGTKRRLTQAAAVDPGFLDVDIAYKDLAVTLLVDDYRQTTVDGYDVLLAHPGFDNFLTLSGSARYDWKPSDALTVTPIVQIKRQIPWNAVGTPADTVGALYYNKVADRYRGALDVAYDLVPGLNLIAGNEIVVDYAQRGPNAPGNIEGLNASFGGANHIGYWTYIALGQLLLQTPVANLTAGARFEYHNQFGPSFVPRVALTKAFDRLSVKLLVSGAFKAPGIENINLNPGVTPERTRVFEAEAGYEIADNLALSVNAFDITIDGPIVYTFDEATGGESYANFHRTGTRGAEVEARLRDAWGSLTLGYAYASAEGKNDVAVYRAGDVVEVMRGMPAHKLTVLGIFRLTDDVTAGPSLVYLSERFGFLGGTDPVVARLPPTALVNVYVRWQDAFVAGLDLGAGLYNILDADDRYLQPYDGGHGPLPAPSREVMARAGYRFGL